MKLKPPFSARKLGHEFEQLALTFLLGKGLRLVCKNFQTRQGEIDLVMKDHTYLVFVEVRYRKYGRHGSALETVNYHKQQKIIRSAKIFLHSRGLTEKEQCRFDVVGIVEKKGTKEISWIKNAFEQTIS